MTCLKCGLLLGAALGCALIHALDPFIFLFKTAFLMNRQQNIDSIDRTELFIVRWNPNLAKVNEFLLKLFYGIKILHFFLEWNFSNCVFLKIFNFYHFFSLCRMTVAFKCSDDTTSLWKVEVTWAFMLFFLLSL